MKIDFISQRREMLLFLATNMAAVRPLVASSQQEYVHDHVQYLSEMVGKSLGLYGSCSHDIRGMYYTLTTVYSF